MCIYRHVSTTFMYKELSLQTDADWSFLPQADVKLCGRSFPS